MTNSEHRGSALNRLRQSLRTLLLITFWVAIAPSANGQTLEDLRRQGIDVSDPNAVMQAARAMGLTDTQIQKMLSQGEAQNRPGQAQQSGAQQSQTGSTEMTAEQARAEAQRYGLDLSDPEAAMERARTLGLREDRVRRMLRAVGQNAAGEGGPSSGRRSAISVELVQLPEISPSPVNVQDDPAVVTVLVTLNATVSDVQMWLAGPSEQDTLKARRAQRVSIGSAMSPVAQGGLSQQGQQGQSFQQGATLGNSAQNGQQGTRETRETWLATIFVPESAISGTYTLGIRAGLNTIDPAGVVKIESEHTTELRPFGYSTFHNVPDAFRPDAMGPVSDGYVVGPQDELRLTVWGAAEFQYDLPVDAEGRVYVPRVGQLTVAGKSIQDLRRDMRIWLSRSYAGLVDEPPSVMMDLTVTRMRPLQVFVLGEVEQPGGYQVPSGSSIFNALYSVGGPLNRGSLRNVRVVRGDRIAEVDLYDYLLKGFRSDALQLQSGDNIFIPPRGKSVSVAGAVRRPAIYEMRDGESFEDLLSFAGGLKAEAYTKRFQIERIVPFAERRDPTKARTVLDLSLADVLSGRDSVRLEDGDRVRIYAINEERDIATKSTIPAVYVTGAVHKPGQFELGPRLQTVSELIEHADGLTGAAYLDKAELIRYGSDLEREILSLDLGQVMEDIPTQNLVLRAQDSLRVFSTLEMRGDRKVGIVGKVLEPGEYDFYDGMTIRDLLFRGGGLRDPEFLKDVFLERADVFRRSPDGSKERIIPFDLASALEGRGLANERLMAGDTIRVYESSVEQLRDRWVVVSGAVKEPGRYRFRDGMSLQDVILQAGGFTEDAYREHVEVTRAVVSLSGSDRARRIDVPLSPEFSLADVGRSGSSFQLASRDAAPLLPSDSLSKSAADDFVLQHRDRIFIRAIPDYKEQEIVTISGEVRFPGEYTLLHQNETLSSVIYRAGGALPTGYTRGGKLIRDGEPVIVEMDRALAGSRGADVILMAGDSLHIPLQPNTVAVRGNVANEGLIKFAPGKRVDYYLDRAGGLQDDTEAILITQASGATYKLKRHLFGVLPRRNPVVDDGATVRVTVKPPAERGPFELRDVTATLTDITAILSTTVTLLILSRELAK